MSTDHPDVFANAMSLSANDRAELAFQLLSSLKPPSVLSEDDPDFVSEIERRVKSYHAGQSQASSIDEVSERVRQALDNGKTQ